MNSIRRSIYCWFSVGFQIMEKFWLVCFCRHAVSSCQRPWYRSQRNDKVSSVNIMFNGKKNKLTEDFPFSSYLVDFVLRTGQFLLGFAGCKRFQLVTFDQVMKANRFINWLWLDEVFHRLLANDGAPRRSFAISGFAGTPDDKQYISLSSTLELKGLVKPEIASVTRLTSCSIFCIWACRKSLWLDISSVLISVRWRVALRKTLTSGLGLDDMSLSWPAVVQLLVFIYSGIQ